MNTPKPFLDVRPWGEEWWLTKDISETPSMIKVISVNPNEALSLQFHHNREEYWTVISGNGIAEVGDKKIPLERGASVFVAKGEKHRIIGGSEVLVFVEIAFGSFDEKDIVRLEDKYGRT